MFLWTFEEPVQNDSGKQTNRGTHKGLKCQGDVFTASFPVGFCYRLVWYMNAAQEVPLREEKTLICQRKSAN